MNPSLPDNSIVLWIVSSLVAFGTITQLLPKAFGPISKGVSKYFSNKRRARERAEDIRISDLGEQNTYLTEELGKSRNEVERIRMYDPEHVAWDYKTYHTIANMPGYEEWPQPPKMHRDKEKTDD